MQVCELLSNTNPSGHSVTLICIVSSKNCELLKVLFMCQNGLVLIYTVSKYFFCTYRASFRAFICGILCFLTVNFIISVLLGDDRMVYIRLVQLTFTNCVYCSAKSLLLCVDTKLLCIVNGTVPNLCPTATAGIVNVSPG